jgi:hypothetical protein
LPEAPIKLWSLIPQGSHTIVHVPLSGVNTMYFLFKKAYDNNLQVPEILIQHNRFISNTIFANLYLEQQNKKDLWNTVFDLERIENRGLQLRFGMKTDGHIISILFEKTALNFVPQNQKETKMQKKRKNLSNWTKGFHPLYKNPFGITENDRIIGIDSGMKNSVILDIVTNCFAY